MFDVFGQRALAIMGFTVQVGAKDGFIHGLPNLRDYFAKAIETLGDKLQLTLDDVLLGAQYSFAMICRCPLN